MDANIWKYKTQLLDHAHIQHFLGVPQIADFGGWKEEPTKFIISWYHGGHLLLEIPVGITNDLIHIITRLPHGGDSMPKTLDPTYWIQQLMGLTTTKN